MTAQKAAMRKIVAFCHETTHVHLVAHPRKGQTEDKAPGKLDVAGSGHITNGADNVFVVWSARKEVGHEDEKPDASLELVKDRNGEAGHRKIYLFFCREAQQYTPDANRRGAHTSSSAPRHGRHSSFEVHRPASIRRMALRFTGKSVRDGAAVELGVRLVLAPPYNAESSEDTPCLTQATPKPGPRSRMRPPRRLQHRRQIPSSI